MYPVYKVRFRWRCANAKNVYLVHSGNNWTTKEYMTKVSQTTFETIIDLPFGEYEYKFIVDGEWKNSDKCPTRKNIFGSYNNVVFICGNNIIKNYIQEHKTVTFKNGVKQYRVFYPNIIDNEKNKCYFK